MSGTLLVVEGGVNLGAVVVVLTGFLFGAVVVVVMMVFTALGLVLVMVSVVMVADGGSSTPACIALRMVSTMSQLSTPTY
jgi:hypothetical protein